MGWFSRMLGREQYTPQAGDQWEVVTNFSPLWDNLGKLSAAELYETQPHLQIVVSYVSRAVAQLGLHLYQRDGETKTRVREGEGIDIFRRFSNTRTDYGLMYALAANLALYDVAYWWIVEGDEGKRIIEILPSWIVKEHGNLFDRPDVDVRLPGRGEIFTIPADQLVRFAGWAPDSVRGVCSPIASLRATLREQIEAVAFRQQVWARGGRVSSVITRPLGAPKMSREAAERFREDWRKNWTGSGAKAGGTPVLDEGMQLVQSGFSPRENEWVDVAKLSLTTVAAAYHVNPTMIGVLDNANYSNVREFRKQLYGDSLGPTLHQIEASLNQYLLPILGLDNRVFYFEFNVAAQLQSTPEEQAQVFSSSVGAPWLTRNEVRAMQNRPPIEGGDELIVPLNVLTGGQASPRDSAPPKKSEVLTKAREPIRVKSPDYVTEDDTEAVHDLLMKFFARQKNAVVSRLGAGRDWWDQKRWDGELADDLEERIVDIADRLGAEAAEQLSAAYDTERTRGYLRAVAESRARWINDATYSRISQALDDLEEDEDSVNVVGEAFESMSEPRALSASGALVSGVASFAVTEAARQSGAQSEKTWIVTSGNPRASHAAMNGETVPVGEDFSNGMRWPGDPEGGADEVAGCMCGLEVEVP